MTVIWIAIFSLISLSFAEASQNGAAALTPAQVDDALRYGVEHRSEEQGLHLFESFTRNSSRGFRVSVFTPTA
jgi:hypothetical protein